MPIRQSKTVAEKYPHLIEEWNYEKNKQIDPFKTPVPDSKKVWWKCKTDPDHEWTATIHNRGRLKRGCPYCSGQKTDPKKSLEALYPDIAADWYYERNGDLKPSDVTAGSARKVWWKCKNNPEHVWSTYIFSRTKNNVKCPYCEGHIPTAQNCLASVYPEVAVEWHPTKNQDKTPYDFTSKSAAVVWWKCKTCLYEWRAQIKNRTLLGSKCPLCSRDDGVIQYKKNKLAREETFEPNYSFEVEDRLFLQYEEIQDIFKNHLKVDSEVRSIESLFTPRNLSKIDYEPYYQRNYVWDNSKATYFIESILIGTEIPPLIFFQTEERVEVIDGRQRFETMKRFLHNEFALSKKGLYLLKTLDKKTFDDLENRLKDLFFDTMIRIIKFTVIDEERLTDKRQDMLKKEIFRRYNSGITPLRRTEIEKAIYIHDEPTKYFRKQFKRNKYLYETTLSLFFPEKDLERADKELTREKVLQEVRFLLVAPEMPIVSTRKKDLLEQFYDSYTERIEDVHEVYRKFAHKIKILTEIKSYFERNQTPTTRYSLETLFWGLSVLEKEKINLEIFKKESELEELSQFFEGKALTFAVDESQFLYKQFMTRYSEMANFFESKFNLSLSTYLSNSIFIKDKLKESEPPQDVNAIEASSFDSVRINKQEAIPYTIDDICRLMLRDRFLVRPVYQRGEVINKLKSSAIIESMLLSIKLPPLFVFKREDGVYEVLDGQQRLLSILGFIGQSFVNESGNQVKSEKDGYKLSKLKILDDLVSKDFNSLSPSLQDKLYDFSLSLIVIDQKINPNFDPVDLFIRLNNRPYPIKENTFEMWNSYVDKDVIDEIKGLVEKHSSWFYYVVRKNDKRMRNEELYTALAYLEYQDRFANHDNSHFYPYLDIYQRESTLNVRVKAKNDITKLLNLASIDINEKKRFLTSLRSIDSFIKRISTILIDKDVSDETSFLDQELTALFNLDNKKYYRRKLLDFYGLWFLVHFINTEMVNKERRQIKSELNQLLFYMKASEKEEDQPERIDEFKKVIGDFRAKFSIADRKVILTNEEKYELIKRQNNICPICTGPLYIHDDIEVDHIDPISIGGKDRFLNLQITHKLCNRKKGAKKNIVKNK